MRYSRLIPVLTIFLAFSALAACGGGGGSTPTVAPPTSTPGGPPPVSPSPTLAPTSTPTVAPTITPTTAPTAPPANSSKTVGAGNGTVNGTDNQIESSAPNTHGNPGEGDLLASDQGGVPGGGGQGAPVDGITCDTSMPNNYHVHAFVGIMNNGGEIALPDGIGMVDPTGDLASYGGVPNQEEYANCFYHMHTHDASGMVHMETASPTCGDASNNSIPCNMTEFNLQNFLDVWGISLTATNFGPFLGPVSIYTSPLQYNPCPTSGGCYTGSSTYSLFTGTPGTLPLYSHTVVWIVIGTPPASPAKLPNVLWFAEH